MGELKHGMSALHWEIEGVSKSQQSRLDEHT